MHYVYVLQSETNQKFYIGYSTNPEARAVKHNEGGNISTKHDRPWKLIYFEGYLNKKDALGRERFLKSGSGRSYVKKQLKNYLDSELQ